MKARTMQGAAKDAKGSFLKEKHGVLVLECKNSPDSSDSWCLKSLKIACFWR